MDLLLAAVFGALVTAVAVLARSIPAEIDRHDQLIEECDQSLAEWVVDQHRSLMQRFHELDQEAASLEVVPSGGTIRAEQNAARTLLLYEYRSELRSARTFCRTVEVEERSAHRFYRRLRGRPFPLLRAPAEATPVVLYWLDGLPTNPLTWTLADAVAAVPSDGAFA
ncbi:MAG TPA: hypothetical protein VD766_00225 [Solirubrobacterales bacterium]|nr:hypothetical protein [Solirubrobacterales bacterium]